jgi:hypothetical protein
VVLGLEQTLKILKSVIQNPEIAWEKVMNEIYCGDKVAHKRLSEKLQYYGIDGTTRIWIDAFPVCIGLYITQSCANTLAVEWRLSAMSLMNTRNNVGPSTVPWGTPDVT